MPIELKMPALSPTMEEGTLAKWLVKAGDRVRSGDIMAEIETDKATMEYEAVDEGIIAEIVVPEGTDGVKVGAVIALIAGEDEATAPQPAAPEPAAPVPAPVARSPEPAMAPEVLTVPRSDAGIDATPLARRLAEQKGIDLKSLLGTGPNGRIVKADLGLNPQPIPAAASAPVVQSARMPAATPTTIPHVAAKLSNMRRTIARRLTESKQTVPHIYLTVDVVLDPLLKLRTELNQALSARGVKLSVNDLLIKALAVALTDVPSCNVEFAGDQLLSFTHADISVAVSIPAGLITPVITDAGAKNLSAISTEMKDLAARARDGKLKPAEYQGGTASLSNMGMYGIKQFEAVINPPQGMIMAIGAGEKRPWVTGDSLGIATVMSATGSFDHRAIDGADGAQLMKRFRELVETPLQLIG